MATLEELQKQELQQQKALDDTKKAIATAQAAEAGKHHAATLATVETYAQHWTPEQKRAFHAHLSLFKPAKKSAAKKSSGGKPKSKDPAASHFQLDTGETFPKKGVIAKSKKAAYDKAIAQYGSRDKFPLFPNSKAPKAPDAKAEAVKPKTGKDGEDKGKDAKA